MATIVDSYSESNYDTDNSVYGAGDDGKKGQSFTSIGAILDSCKFYLKKNGSPTGNVVAKLYAHSGTFGVSGQPTGSPLATSENFDVSTLTTSMSLTEFTFAGAERIALTNGTHYCIIVEYTGGDSGNCVVVGSDASSPTHSGNKSYIFWGFWSGNDSQDICFYVYGNPIMLLECGNFVLSGKDVGLRMARRLAMACGTFTLTGIDVILTKGKTIICECGKFILTGINVKLDRGWMRKYSEKAGSFTRKYAEKVGSWINKY